MLIEEADAVELKAWIVRRLANMYVRIIFAALSKEHVSANLSSIRPNHLILGARTQMPMCWPTTL